MKPTILYSIIIVVLFSSLFAMDYGSLEGRVYNCETGEPLSDAVLEFIGENFKAQCDKSGNFTIHRIMAGSYNIRISKQGYIPVVRDSIVVVPDKKTILEIGLLTVIPNVRWDPDNIAQFPKPPKPPKTWPELVEKEYDSQRYVLTRNDIQALPYRDLASLLNTLPGFDAFDRNADQPRFRGGTAGESRIFVDGMDMSDAATAQPFYYMDLHNIERIEVLPGWFGVEYGDARSAIIKITTRKVEKSFVFETNTRYSREGLKHFGPMAYSLESPINQPFASIEHGAFTGNEYFQGWNAYSGLTGSDGLDSRDPHYARPYENYALYLWRHRSMDNLNLLRDLDRKGLVDMDLSSVTDEDAYLEYGDLPDWQGEIFAGGVVPKFNWINWTFYHSQDETEYAITMPNDTYRERSTQANVHMQFGRYAGMDVQFRNDRQYGIIPGAWHENNGTIASNPFNVFYPANRLWYPHFKTPMEYNTRQGLVRFEHQILPKLLYQLEFTYALTEYDVEMQQRNTAPIQGNKFNLTHLQYGRIGNLETIQEFIDKEYYKWENWQDWAKIRIGDYWYDESPYGMDPVMWKDLSELYMMGGTEILDNESLNRRVGLKGHLYYDPANNHKIKFGFETMRNRILFKFHQIYSSLGSGYIDWAESSPWQSALYISDFWQINRKFSVYTGLRYDRIDQGEVISFEGDEDDLRNGPFSNILAPGHRDSTKPVQNLGCFILSPRIYVNYDIGKETRLYFNFGRFTEWPDAADKYMFAYKTTDGYRIDPVANPNLKSPSSVNYEFGMSSAVWNKIQTQIAIYAHDIKNEYSKITTNFTYFFYVRDELWSRNFNYKKPVNNINRSVSGVEFTLDYSPFNWFNTIFYYNGQRSSKQYYGYQVIYQDPSIPDEPFDTKKIETPFRSTLRWQVHAHTPQHMGPGWAGIHPFGGWQMAAVYTWREGETFQWQRKDIQWRPYQNTDLRISKALFSFGNARAVMYMDVFNLFNNKNMNTPNGYVYDDDGYLTGVDANWTWDAHPLWQDEFVNYMNSFDIDGGDRPGDYPHDGEKEYIDMPGFTPWTFLNKRDIFWGLNIQVNI